MTTTRPLPDHGTPARYKRGCRCTACRAAVAAVERNRYWAKKTGRYQAPYVPLTLVRSRLELLASTGLTLAAIAEAAGIPTGSLRNAHDGRRTRFSAGAAARLSLVRATLDEIPDRPYLSALGTRRRLQALACNGWSTPVMADETGIALSTIVKLRCGEVKTARASTVRAIRDAYERLSGSDAPASKAAVRSRTESSRRGWMPPGAWAGVNIEDPAAEPARRLESERWTAEELVEESEFLRLNLGLDRAQIADRLGLTRDAIHAAYSRARKYAERNTGRGLAEAA